MTTAGIRSIFQVILFIYCSALFAACGGGGGAATGGGEVIDSGETTPTVTANAGVGGSLFPGDTLVLDASRSFDPEGGALTFAWSVSQSQDVTLVDNGATASLSFARPGLYEFTVTATDPLSNPAAITREVAVYNAADFSSFSASWM